MDQGPLVNDQVAAGAEFIHRLRNHFLVDYALWVKDSEEGRWSFLIVSSEVNDHNFDVAYGAILQVAGAMPTPKWIDPFQVKMISMDDPMARAIQELYRRHPIKLATRYGLCQLGNLAIEEAFLYPPSALAPIKMA